MAFDPCKLAKAAADRAEAEEGKGCDERHHPLRNVRDNGRPLDKVTSITCISCRKEIDLIKFELEPHKMTYGDDTEGVEFRVVFRRYKGNIETPRTETSVLSDDVKICPLSSGGVSYTYNSNKMMSRPSFWPRWFGK